MKGELRKDQILQSAQKIFSQKGYYETQVSDIVDDVHIGKGTIYQYFKNKEDIFLTLLKKYLEEWKKAIDIDLKNFKDPNPDINYLDAYLRQRMSKTLNFFLNDPDRSNIILRLSPGLNRSVEPIINTFENAVMRFIIHDLRIGRRLGFINSEVDIELLGNTIYGGIMRICYYYFVVKKNDALDITILINEAVNFLTFTISGYRPLNNVSNQ